MDKIKLWLSQFKQFLQKFSKKTLGLIIGGAVLVLVLAIVGAVMLNRTSYEVLFAGVAPDEATQITGRLQEQGIEYQYLQNGDILVDSKVVDNTRATLVFEGYPKSGFAYGTYLDNAGGMSTDAENQQLELYDLQDRIGSTIRLWGGVKDAKVTIALVEEDQYILSPASEKEGSSASVTIIMNDGGAPSAEQAQAAQRLVSTSVAGMLMEDVVVIDGNGLEVSTAELTGEGVSAEETLRQMENELTRKAINVLIPFYGEDNVRVSVWGKLNSASSVKETTTYTTPDKIDEFDKEGIVSHETTSSEILQGGDGANEVVGTETNAEATQYNGNEDTAGGDVLSTAADRDYLVNQEIEQTQQEEGATIEDVSVAVSINSFEATIIDESLLRDLIGNATGIAADVRADKISIIAAPFYGSGSDSSGLGIDISPIEYIQENPLVAIIGLAVLILVIVLAIILAKRSKKKRLAAAAEAAAAGEIAGFVNGDGVEFASFGDIPPDKSTEIRDMVRAFADENPEISAQMIRQWLNGGDESGT